MKKRGKRVSGKAVSSSRASKGSNLVIASQRKFNLVISNLLVFVTIFVISLGLYLISSNEFYANMFWMISLITGFLSVALLIVFLIFIVLKYLKK